MDLLALFHVESGTELAWVLVGFLAQVLFGGRFVLQWWRSEKAGESVVPVGFWWLSITGGALMLAYALYRMDPVFVLGQGLGLVVYLRNLALIRKAARRRA
ncbi:lipid-A-disaccharide synthase N-terminal domain-containing protein [Rubellimicrobium aerolatum]|uniref:Lipid-A-disaccharide synthase N-terminal domain-containing protein n=1 Tax=Rubellimicrobium aerolatum TaxID=490979 RepID=A0ABW0S9M5_9RHOB|nr:lipid-A-disaccharide synthase N-terminal domain-containing protein [Rubellimicrobium aerolatum]MBP1804946.1 lipid-A-disaccharide synthase-like uncharacterized protein [Rubellimicrobium aerolatum]